MKTCHFRTIQFLAKCEIKEGEELTWRYKEQRAVASEFAYQDVLSAMAIFFYPAPLSSQQYNRLGCSNVSVPGEMNWEYS